MTALDQGVGEWRRVSPKYVVTTLVGDLVPAVLFTAAAIVLVVIDLPWPAAPVGVVAILFIIAAILSVRRVRSIGYQLRRDDLLFRRGLLFTRVVAVPYGRMQLVDVQAGPIARALGYASLKMVTATSVTGVTIPGLPTAEADQLRDRLVELAETRRAGL